MCFNETDSELDQDLFVMGVVGVPTLFFFDMFEDDNFNNFPREIGGDRFESALTLELPPTEFMVLRVWAED